MKWKQNCTCYIELHFFQTFSNISIMVGLGACDHCFFKYIWKAPREGKSTAGILSPTTIQLKKWNKNTNVASKHFEGRNKITEELTCNSWPGKDILIARAVIYFNHPCTMINTSQKCMILPYDRRVAKTSENTQIQASENKKDNGLSRNLLATYLTSLD